jgi:hypothetical protein
MRPAHFVAFGSALFALACGHVERHEVVFRTAPPTPSADVYLEGQPIEAPVEEMAILQVMAYGDAAGTESAVADLRARAAALGCDAVVRVKVVNGATGTHAWGVCARRLAPVK